MWLVEARPKRDVAPRQFQPAGRHPEQSREPMSYFKAAGYMLLIHLAFAGLGWWIAQRDGALAATMIALAFLYFTASIFIFGGELNAAILRARIKPADEAASAPVH